MTALLVLALCAVDPEVYLDFTSLTRDMIPTYLITEFDHPENPVDILHYDISLEVFLDLHEITGTTEIEMTSSTAAITDIRLDLRQLTADSVWDATGVLPYYQQDDSIFITLGETLNPGDTTDVYISYGGEPYHESWGGFWFAGNVLAYHIGVGVSTEGQTMGKCMFPCWDHQNDKATFDFHITCDEDMYAVANGDSAGVSFSGGKATYNWTIDQQMPTYLVALNVGDYEVLHDSTDARIYYYVYSWDVDDALASFVNVNEMMLNLESTFGPYPWNTRFSLVETPKGDMEHVSHVTHTAAAVNGNTNYDWLIAHEMTHHWWGCCVTMADWQHIWLKEGFATIGEALWMETYGQEAYDDYMINEIMKPYLQSGEVFPISNPQTPAEVFSATTYDKAGAVLHMLRYVLGDDDFFGALNYYFDNHMYGLVWTDDFRDDLESYLSSDIDWFFDKWIHGWGYPIYDIEHSIAQAGATWELTIDISQIQTTETIFEMPLELMVHGSASDTVVVMWNNLQTQSETYTVSFEPDSVTFDPYHHILCGNVLLGIESPVLPPGGVSTAYVGPNPARTNSSSLLCWPGTEQNTIEATVFDLNGRAVLTQNLTPGNRSINLIGLPASTYLLQLTTNTNIKQTTKLVVLE